MPLDTLAARHAVYRRDDLALVFGRHRLTHAEVGRRVNRAANAFLGLGLAKGHRVGLLLDNSLALFDLYQIAARTGIVVVPLSPLLRREALAGLLGDAEVAAVVAAGRLTDELETLREALPLAAGRLVVADGAPPPGWLAYDELVAAAPDSEPPDAGVRGDDPLTSSTARARRESRKGSSTRTRSGRRTGRALRARSGSIRRASSCTRAPSSSTARS